VKNIYSLSFSFQHPRTLHPKGVDKKKKIKTSVGFLMKSDYVISLDRLDAKLEDAV
jgi:hypothetical protein